MRTKKNRVSLCGPVWTALSESELGRVLNQRVRVASCGLGTIRGLLVGIRPGSGIEIDRVTKRQAENWYIPFEALLFVEEL